VDYFRAGASRKNNFGRKNDSASHLPSGFDHQGHKINTINTKQKSEQTSSFIIWLLFFWFPNQFLARC